MSIQLIKRRDRACRRALARALGGIGLWVMQAAAQAGGPVLEPFTPDTWSRLPGQLPRPALVVFTAHTCAVCPGVVASVQRSLRERSVRATQVVVFMDAEPTGARAPEFKAFDRRFVLRGPELPVRYRVNPAWRGELPYLVLLDARGGMRDGVGLPTPAVIEAWLQPEGTP